MSDKKAPPDALNLVGMGLQLRCDKDAEGLTLILSPLHPHVGQTTQVRLTAPSLDWFREQLDYWEENFRGRVYQGASIPAGATVPAP